MTVASIACWRISLIQMKDTLHFNKLQIFLLKSIVKKRKQNRCSAARCTENHETSLTFLCISALTSKSLLKSELRGPEGSSVENINHNNQTFLSQ